jgi:hypothetical protein
MIIASHRYAVANFKEPHSGMSVHGDNAAGADSLILRRSKEFPESLRPARMQRHCLPSPAFIDKRQRVENGEWVGVCCFPSRCGQMKL